MPYRCRRPASRRAVDIVASGASSPRAAVDRVQVLRERAGMVPGDRRDDVARPVGAELRAQHDDAAREVAAQPRGAAHDLAGLDLAARAQVLEEGAAEV